MEQMDILEEYLKANDYDYKRRPLVIPGEMLVVYDYKDNYVWDVSYCVGANGGRDSLLEGTGSIFAVDGEDVVESNLTAQDVIDRLESLVIKEDV